MNEERPIEQLLRRAARKRAGEAGDPPELHSANRRQLQEEVARQFPPPEPDRSVVATLWLALKQRWAYALVAIPVLGLLAFVLGPALFKAGNDQLAMNQAKPEPMKLELKDIAYPAPAASPPLTSTATEMAESSSTLENSGRSGGGNLRPAPATSAVTRQPAGSAAFVDAATDRTTRNDLPRANDALAAGNLARSQLSQTKSKELAYGAGVGGQEESVAATSGLATAIDSVRPTDWADKSQLMDVGGKDVESLELRSQAFSNVSAEQNQPRKRTGVALPVPVLVNFKVQQQGRDMQVIDGDGSIYRGVVDEENTLYKQIIAQKNQKLRGNFDNSQKFQPPKLADTVTAAKQEESDYYLYRVEGTNRALNQKVVFSWNFIPTNEALAAAQYDYKNALLNTELGKLPSQLPALLNNSYINGRAETSDRRLIEVNAVPVQ